MASAAYDSFKVVRLIGSSHSLPQLGFIDIDYPFGFRLRCVRRTWIETHPKKGQRIGHQTTIRSINQPDKLAGIVDRINAGGEQLESVMTASHLWNAAKYGIYHPIVIVGLDAEDHQTVFALHLYSSVETVVEFDKFFSPKMDEQQLDRFTKFANVHRRMNAKRYEELFSS